MGKVIKYRLAKWRKWTLDLSHLQIIAKTLVCTFIKSPVCLPACAYLSTHTHCVSCFVFMKTEHPEILFWTCVPHSSKYPQCCHRSIFRGWIFKNYSMLRRVKTEEKSAWWSSFIFWIWPLLNLFFPSAFPCPLT